MHDHKITALKFEIETTAAIC